MENNNTILEHIMSLTRASRRKKHSEHEGKYEVPFASFRILRLISNNEGIIASELAKMLDIRPASMTEALSKMEAVGLINREKDQQDSRAMIVTLTDKGKEVIEKKKQHFEARNEKLESILTLEEKEQFFTICNRLTQFFEEENPNTDEAHTKKGKHHGKGQYHHGKGEHPHKRCNGHHRKGGQHQVDDNNHIRKDGKECQGHCKHKSEQVEE